ncbi:MAG: PAS domain S-box protein [Verrucomicrobiota bacterium]
MDPQEMFRFATDQAAHAIYGMNRDASLCYVNDQACRSLGYTSAELLKLSIFDIDPDFTPEMWEKAWDRFHRREVEVMRIETRHRRKDGSIFPVEIASKHFWQGQTELHVAFVVDLTERKRIEKQIREQAALLDFSHNAVLVWEPGRGINFMNRAAEQLTGWPSGDAGSRSIEEILRTRSELVLRGAMKDVLQRGEWTGEMPLLTRDGKEREVESRWTLLGEAAAKTVLITCNDITDKNRLEKQYLRAQRLESVGTLASGVAHDLNNILSPILMGLDMLDEVIQDEEHRGILTMMQDSAKRGKDTVRQLLTFARGTETRKGPVQPRHLLKEISRLVEQTFPKNIQIYTDFSARAATVLADPSQLHQVLVNLCVNARDAMAAGGVLFVTVENHRLDAAAANLHPKARPGEYVVFKVADSGSGISPEILDRIFDPFFTTKPQGKGTGLGLASVLGIVEGHGGFVTVESKVGTGTTFSVYLPAQDGVERAATNTTAPASPQGNGETILVVDDEPAILRLAESVLRHNGYEVLTASNSSEAIHLWERHFSKIKVVLTDIMMPFGDGRQLITALFQQDPKLNIVAMSGLATKEFVRDTLKRGARMFLSKPFTAEQLLTSLHELLHGQSKSG